MATIEPYETKGGKRYRVIYRRPDHTQTSKRGFKTRRDANSFLASVTVAVDKGEYIDPANTKATITTLGQEWLTAREAVVKPSWYRTLESSWRVHVEPKWGAMTVGQVQHSAVQSWVSELAKTTSATTVLRVHGILAGILDAAVADRRTSRNVARGVMLPRRTNNRKIYLSHEQVQDLADASQQATLVLFLAYTGLRWGEATGLRIHNLDMLRRRVQISENAVMVGGKIIVGTPKTHEARSVPFPQFLSEPIAKLCEGKTREALLFGDGHNHLRLPNSIGGWFTMSVQRCQKDCEAWNDKHPHAEKRSFPRVTPHDLRHTAASLAISAGANVKAVQRMLGHASAAMTLDTYAELFDDDLDDVATALDQARANSNVANMLPKPTIEKK